MNELLPRLTIEMVIDLAIKLTIELTIKLTMELTNRLANALAIELTNELTIALTNNNFFIIISKLQSVLNTYDQQNITFALSGPMLNQVTESALELAEGAEVEEKAKLVQRKKFKNEGGEVLQGGGAQAAKIHTPLELRFQ